MERVAGIAIFLAAAVMVAGVSVYILLAQRPARPEGRPAGSLGAGSVVPPADIARLQGIEVRMDELERKVAELKQTAEKLKLLKSRIDSLGESLEAVAQAAGNPPAQAPPAAEPDGAAGAAGKTKLVISDGFEEGTAGWFVPKAFEKTINGEIAHETAEGAAREGRGALRLSCAYEPGKVGLAVRAGPGVNAVNRLEFWVRSERATMVFVGATELDRSSYGTAFELRPEDGWFHCAVDYSEFRLTQGSSDENGRLDAGQVAALCVGDLGAFIDLEGKNVLLIDSFRGLRTPPAAAEPEGEF